MNEERQLEEKWSNRPKGNRRGGTRERWGEVREKRPHHEHEWLRRGFLPPC